MREWRCARGDARRPGRGCSSRPIGILLQPLRAPTRPAVEAAATAPGAWREAGVGLLDGPGRREAARHGCGPGLYAAASPRSGIHGARRPHVLVRHMLNGDLIQGEWTASEPA